MKKEQIFTEEEMDNLVNFYSTLLKIDRRLRKEGYQIKDGKFIPPKNKVAVEKLDQ